MFVTSINLQTNIGAGQREVDLYEAEGGQQEDAGGVHVAAGDVRQDQHGARQDQGHGGQAQGGLREGHIRPRDVQRKVRQAAIMCPSSK